MTVLGRFSAACEAPPFQNRGEMFGVNYLCPSARIADLEVGATKAAVLHDVHVARDDGRRLSFWADWSSPRPEIIRIFREVELAPSEVAGGSPQ
jgi:hypothetical protein